MRLVRALRRQSVCLLLICLVLSNLGTLPARGYANGFVEIEGHGFGHGRGMGQWGALGYAVNFSWNHQQIVGHFYGGTTSGNVGNPEMSVRLTAFDGFNTNVNQERGHLRTNVAEGTFFALSTRRIGPNIFEVYQAPACNGPWSLLHGGASGPIVVSPTTPSDDRGEMLQACEPTGPRRWLRGSLKAVDDAGSPRTVNVLDTESYLRGVVPRESPASWGDSGGGKGLQALKAQAVAARSYSISENRYSYAKTCDTTSCQVYKGHADLVPGGTVRVLEDPRTDRAIAETAGEVRMKSGAVARTEFSSSTGGYSAGGAFPAVPDEGDSISSNANHRWRVSIPVSAVESAWPEIGSLMSFSVTRRNGLGDWGGRITEARIQGTAGTVFPSGNTVRSRLGLKSDWFSVLDPGWEYLGGSISSGPDAASQAPNRLDVFALGDDKALWRKVWNGSAWVAWEPLGGFLTSDPTSVSWGVGRVDVFARGGDNALWHIWYDGQWSGWQSLGGFITSAPDAASWSEGRLDVVARGGNGELWKIAWDGSHWEGWASVGGQIKGDPSVISWGVGRLDVFARGGDNALWHRPYDGQWGGWNSLGGQITSGPDASSWGQNRLDAFARGLDNALWHMWWDGYSWSGWESLSGTLTSDPSAVSWEGGRIDVFARSKENSLMHKWFSGSWSG